MSPRPNLDARTALRMTRPGFVVITVAACSLGFAVAHWQGATLSAWAVTVVTLLAVLMHAAANVLNDYHDACNGADDANPHGLFPFTGGARLIQNGEVTPQQTRQLAYALAAAVVPAGLWLVWFAGPVVLALGLAGVALGWAYSAPPFRLMTRGAGEFTVGLAWALIVVGCDAVVNGGWRPAALWAGAGYGALIANILLINAFPDAAADAQVGKGTAVVRIGPRAAAGLYVALCGASAVALLTAISAGALPVEALWAGISGPTAMAASVGLWRHAHEPQALRGAIVLTIATAVLYAVGLSVGCWLATPHGLG